MKQQPYNPNSIRDQLSIFLFSLKLPFIWLSRMIIGLILPCDYCKRKLPARGMIHIAIQFNHGWEERLYCRKCTKKARAHYKCVDDLPW